MGQREIVGPQERFERSGAQRLRDIRPITTRIWSAMMSEFSSVLLAGGAMLMFVEPASVNFVTPASLLYAGLVMSRRVTLPLRLPRTARAADSAPGVLGALLGKSCFFYGAHEEERLKGLPGQILAQRDGAICVGTVDGAVWISHLKAKDEAEPRGTRRRLARGGPGNALYGSEIKLPATQALGPLLRSVPEAPLPIDALVDHRTFREIVYCEEDDVGYLSFDFYNGAMSTQQCYRLRDAFLHARARPTRVIVLLGGADFWSNGIHLNVIEASADPGAESWRNINAIDDLIFEILNTMSHLVVAGLRGNAGAGGAILALAADRIYARSGIVLNPHYRSMGNLYGSEYWTYTLPRHVGETRALELIDSCTPIGAKAALETGFLDGTFGEDTGAFVKELREQATRLARQPEYRLNLRRKHEQRLDDESAKPLARYRAEELQRMWVNFFGPDPAYHEARRRFVFKGNLPPKHKLAVEVETTRPPRIHSGRRPLEDVAWPIGRVLLGEKSLQQQPTNAAT